MQQRQREEKKGERERIVRPNAGNITTKEKLKRFLSICIGADCCRLLNIRRAIEQRRTD